jgi:hypothetical protein
MGFQLESLFCYDGFSARVFCYDRFSARVCFAMMGFQLESRFAMMGFQLESRFAMIIAKQTLAENLS